MGGKPKLCPHGILGISKCINCEREWNNKYRKTHRKQLIINGAKFRNNHREEHNRKSREYNKIHKDKKHASSKKYADKNREKIKERMRLYSKNNQKLHNEQARIRWANNPIKYREKLNERRDKRHRDLDRIPLNNYFEGSHGHHINKEDIIYIPKWLHLSLLPHSARTGLNMNLVNDIIFQYLECTNQVEWIN